MMAILLVPMRAPIMRFQMRADAPSAGNRKRDVFGELSPKEQIDFFRELDEACEAAGVPDDELARFQGLRDAMSADSPPWQVLETGQVVLSAKYFPGLTAKPAWDREADDENCPFAWLSKLETYAPVIASEPTAVCGTDLPPDFCKDLPNPYVQQLTGLTETERAIYVPGFDDRPTNGYCQTVLVANDEPQKVAALFPQTMAALDACKVPFGVRLVAFGKQLSHTALHWHSDGRNFMLTAHLPLAGPSKRAGARAPAFGRTDSANAFPSVAMRDGASGMTLSPLLASAPWSCAPWSRVARWLGTALSGRRPWRSQVDAGAVSRSWTPSRQNTVGPGVVFDTTFMHSAYNDGNQNADILFIDFFHPELSHAEQEAIKCLQKLLRDRGEAPQPS